MKLELLTLEMFKNIYREMYENSSKTIGYIEFLKQNQKLYNDFSDDLFELSLDSRANEVKIIQMIQNQIEPEIFYYWMIIKGRLKKDTELKDVKSLDSEPFLNDFVKSNIKFISAELARDTAEIADFLLDEIFVYDQINNANSNIKSPDQETDKIAINGNVQLWGFLFNELINKGYITAPKHNGKVSYAKFARQLLQHFEFSSQPNEKQPSENYLTKALKENKYSNNKQEVFKIPNIKIAND